MKKKETVKQNPKREELSRLIGEKIKKNQQDLLRIFNSFIDKKLHF